MSTQGACTVAFGVYDMLHDGHRHFLRQAALVSAGAGRRLVVVVTRDAVVETLKKRRPHQPEHARVAAITAEYPSFDVVLGDPTLGAYTVLRQAQEPCLVCLGYDQHRLGDDLRLRISNGELRAAAVHVASALDGDRLHTSLLHPHQPQQPRPFAA
jgi:cytidyltransferase-like protein